MLRRLAKSGIAWGFRGTGADRIVGALRNSRLPLVLGYHRVVEDFARSAPGSLPGLIISRGVLERQLDWLGRRFRFVSLDELAPRLEAGDDFREPVAAVTFDDGYADVYENAYPLLRAKGIPAAVFVVSDLVGTGQLQLYDRLYILLARAFSKTPPSRTHVAPLLRDLGLPVPSRVEPRNAFAALEVLLDAYNQADLRRIAWALESGSPIDARAFPELRPLRWDMLREMRRSGLMTIGSHTRSHSLLTREDPPRLDDETAGSRRALEQALGGTVEHFAYPGGRFDDVSVAAVAAAGYRIAYTICRHRDARHRLLTIPRRMLWETSCLDVLGHFSGALMSCQANGVFDRMSGCTHPARRTRPSAAIAS
jgi:peptidoglycan/xylan/chitin deacetylase (PgdA/CDA1 family)